MVKTEPDNKRQKSCLLCGKIIVTMYNKNSQNPQMYIKKYNNQMDNRQSICYNQLCMKISKMPCQG